MSTTARQDLDEAEARLLNAKLDMQRRALRREFGPQEAMAMVDVFRVALDSIRALRLALPDRPRTKEGPTDA